MDNEPSLFRRLQRRLGAETRRRVEEHQALVSFNEEHGENYVRGKVESQDSKPEQVRGGSEFVHGSSLAGLCARREVLASISPPNTVSVWPADRIVWAMGRAAEKHVRTQFIDARRREGIVGAWSCRCGKTKHEGLYNHQVRCSTCRDRASNYGEISLFDYEMKIVGNPDLLFVRPDNYKLRVLEIKSMNKAEFEELVRPKPDHVIQALVYRRLLERNRMDPDDGATIFYVCKDYRVRGGVYREFHVTGTENSEALLDGMWERARAIRDWKIANGAGANQDLPPRLPACNSPTAPMAKNCDRCTACFARP